MIGSEMDDLPETARHQYHNMEALKNEEMGLYTLGLSHDWIHGCV